MFDSAEAGSLFGDLYVRALLDPDAAVRIVEAIAWEPHGLPPDFFPLLAPAGRAFVRQGQIVVSHGGCSLEEVVVPLVDIERDGP